MHASSYNYTMSYRLLQCCTDLYRVVQCCADLYNVVQTCTMLYKLVQCCTDLYNFNLELRKMDTQTLGLVELRLRSQKMIWQMFLVTFYTVAKVNVVCGRTDHKIGLSRGWSNANLLLSTVGFAGGTYWLSVYYLVETIIILIVPFYILAVIFTVIFLNYDTFCCASCCCECCIGEEQVVIHDPSNPEANLVWRNGEVSECVNKLLRS